MFTKPSAFTLRVISIGRLAKDLLVTRPEKARIVAVLRNAAYARTDSNELLSLTTSEERAPWAVNMESEETPLRPIARDGEPVYARETSLFIGPARVDLDAYSVYEKQSPSMEMNGISARILRAQRLLSLLELSGSILDWKDPFAILARPRLRELAVAVMNHQFQTARMRVNEVMGLGRGFTPSADDFLVGVFGFYHEAYQSRPRITLPPRTNWISQKMVEYSMSGMLRESAARLVDGILSGTKQDMSHAIAGLARVGHTSGIDICAGMLEAAAILAGQPELGSFAAA